MSSGPSRACPLSAFSLRSDRPQTTYGSTKTSESQSSHFYKTGADVCVIMTAWEGA